MLSNALAARLGARGMHYGWVVVAVTFLTMLTTAAALGSAGVLIQPLRDEFSWTTAQISSALAIRLLLFGLVGPFAAAMMNGFGLRRVTGVALGLLIAGTVLSLLMTEPWQMMLCWGLILGLGSGMTALVLGATVAARWFTARRGLVVGLMTASNATGQLVFLPLLASITEAMGWRAALGLMVAVLTVVLILMMALLRDHPSDLGLPPYGEARVLPEPPRPAGLAVLLAMPVRALAEASRTRTFWVLFATFFICGLSTNGLIQTHWVSICGDFGIAPVGAAGLLAVIGVFDLVGTIGSGWLSDRFDNRWLLFWFYGLRGLSLMFLSVTGFDVVTLSIFAVFYGLDWVSTVPPTVRLAAERFGRERAGLAFGWIFCGHQLGAATAALGAGTIRTDFATYMPALWIAGAMCLVAAVSLFAISRPEREPVVAAA
jgi:MFS family permease